MLILIHILIRIIFQPGRYHLTGTHMVDDQLAIFCGTKAQVEKLNYIITKRLIVQIENDIREFDKHKAL